MLRNDGAFRFAVGAVVCLLLLAASEARPAATTVPEGYSYLSPRDGAELVNPETTIALRLQVGNHPARLPTTGAFRLEGSASGIHELEMELARDGRTLILTPREPFETGEEVTLRFVGDGASWPAFTSRFTVSSRGVEPHIATEGDVRRELARLHPEETGLGREDLPGRWQEAVEAIRSTQEEHLPTLLPEYEWTFNGTATPDYIYLTAGNYPEMVYFRFIFDGEGNLVLWDWHDAPVFEFRYYPEHDLMAWYEYPEKDFYVADMGGTIVDTISAGNGYGPETDFHELLLLPNGNRCLIIYDHETLDMSQVVEGGNPEADVAGIVLQELDQDDNVVFEWRSWDHVEITDAVEDVDLTGEHVDYMHSNTIEIDTDGNWIISSRHFDEVTKINRTTGDIIWRMGGENNEFDFVNDPEMFTGQHFPRRMEDGDILLFDNGHWHDNPLAAAKEYTVDTTAMTATLDWEYVEDERSWSQGSSTRMANGNTVIGWGAPASGVPHVSEVTSDGAEVWNFRIPWIGSGESGYFSTYRAHTSAVMPSYSVPHLEAETFTDGRIRLYFDQFGRGDIAHYEVYTGTMPNPVTFVEVTDRYYDINASPDETWYARVKGVDTTGTASEFSAEVEIVAGVVGVGEEPAPARPSSPLLLEVAPNPFNPTATVTVELASAGPLEVRVFDLLGRELATLADGVHQAGLHRLHLDGSAWASGTYLVRARTGEGTAASRRISLVK